MTTNLQSATPADLLAFLRSAEPIPRKATVRPRPAAAVREPRPLTPIEAATLRRPPRAADRCKAATGGDYESRRRHELHCRCLAATECRLVAWLVSKALGPAWRFEPAGDSHRCHRIVHRATTATLLFRHCWRDDKRYEIVPENVHRSDQLPRSITVSGERPPAEIAGDIERRLVAVGLFDQNAAHLHAGHKQRAEEVKSRRRLLAVANTLGAKLLRDCYLKSRTYPEATTTMFGPCLEDRFGVRRETEVSAATGYGGLEIEIHTCSVEFAVHLGEFIRRYYAENG